MPDSSLVAARNLSNEEFLNRYARAGRVGLSGGPTLVDKAICRAQRHLHPDKQWGLWSHAFLFQGVRPDGHHWVIESDLQIHRKHIQLGVQENRISKYYDQGLYSNLAVLDFGLAETQISDLLAHALDQVANRTRYSLRELCGTLIALRHPELRGRNNLLARDRSAYCSAFVQHLFDKIGLDLSPGIDGKNTTPEHISLTSLPHTRYVLQRVTLSSKLQQVKKIVREKSSKLAAITSARPGQCEPQPPT